VVLAILGQDSVNLLGAVPTDIWSKHNAAAQKNEVNYNYNIRYDREQEYNNRSKGYL
jgi:hypothetical protein